MEAPRPVAATGGAMPRISLITIAVSVIILIVLFFVLVFVNFGPAGKALAIIPIMLFSMVVPVAMSSAALSGLLGSVGMANLAKDVIDSKLPPKQM